MDRDFNKLLACMEKTTSLEFINELIGFIRKYHRRMDKANLARLLKIVIEVLNRDVELIDPNGWLIKNFDYFILNLEDRYDINLDQFKYKVLYEDFSLKDIADLLVYIKNNVEELTGDLDFILRVPESLFKAELKLKNINEYEPSMQRWEKTIYELRDNLKVEK